MSKKHDYPSRPVVERSDELAEGQVVLNVLDGRVGLVGASGCSRTSLPRP
jgi:hypothetical protein